MYSLINRYWPKNNSQIPNIQSTKFKKFNKLKGPVRMPQSHLGKMKNTTMRDGGTQERKGMGWVEREP